MRADDSVFNYVNLLLSVQVVSGWSAGTTAPPPSFSCLSGHQSPVSTVEVYYIVRDGKTMIS